MNAFKFTRGNLSCPSQRDCSDVLSKVNRAKTVVNAALDEFGALQLAFARLSGELAQARAQLNDANLAINLSLVAHKNICHRCVR
jgi:hypothetical protein